MKKYKLLGLAGILAVAAVGGTFAYYNVTQTFNNPFDTTNYSTYAVEKFNPGDGHEWKPGAKVDKEVIATNTGDGEVWVRVKLEEYWKNKKGEFNRKDSGDADFYLDSAEAGEATQPEHNGLNGTEDGLTNGDSSVVFKEFAEANVTEDGSENNKWYKVDDYYYYTSALAKNGSTLPLLKSVELCEDADMGKFTELNYYAIVDKGADRPSIDPLADEWVQEELKTDEESLKQYVGKDIYTYKADKLDDEAQGYANANYELDITVEFVQTDENGESAGSVEWAWYPGKPATTTP